ncbi:hypothetical protein TSUD_276570 [Trifolium subterraneum]|uniref:NB-ARC domain-containing protein n=1 Tax=Trifolium subterraneum TaxID=3900 RepID=A0A2Z6N746_TRISU|nr:hypothetical protein TSUD_276570 [Trifolium subterraneum]
MAQFELIPYSVVESLENNLYRLASSDFGRIPGVVNELRKLHNTIVRIRAVFLDANEIPKRYSSTSVWLRNLKYQLLVADDFFDEIATESLQLKRLDCGKVCGFFSCKNGFVFRIQIARKIEEIRKMFQDPLKKMKFNLDPPVSESMIYRKKTHSYCSPTDIIGREDEIREILRMLRQPDGTHNVSLIGVVGIGGIGKTAVSRMVYNDRQVNDFFQFRMWVDVSDDFDVKIIAKTIINLLGSWSNPEESLEILQNGLRERLDGKRYLLVLDNIWNESQEKWTQLKPYLMCGAQGRKILLTTCSTKVTEVMEISSLIHLKSLTEEDSWSLFKSLVFREDDNHPILIHSLEPVRKKIVKKCRGVPLAIQTVARFLYFKRTESDWIEFLEGDFWKRGEQIDDFNIISSLEFSYQHLSAHQLQQCFAYCSIYLTGQEIEKNELIQLWMAQDYLKYLSGGQEMEDIGNEFVNALLNIGGSWQ